MIRQSEPLNDVRWSLEKLWQLIWWPGKLFRCKESVRDLQGIHTSSYCMAIWWHRGPPLRNWELANMYDHIALKFTIFLDNSSWCLSILPIRRLTYCLCLNLSFIVLCLVSRVLRYCLFYFSFAAFFHACESCCHDSLESSLTWTIQTVVVFPQGLSSSRSQASPCFFMVLVSLSKSCSAVLLVLVPKMPAL